MTLFSKYDEQRLLLSIAEGNEQSFSAMYVHYYAQLYAHVLKIVKVPTVAEDIVQDVFLKIWETRTQLAGVRHFAAFLYTVARNHSLNALQSIARSNNALPAMIRHFAQQRVDDEILSNDYRRFIERALQSIPPRSREVFRKCREEKMTYDQVAAQMAISRNAVKKHMVTSIRILKEAVGKDLDISLKVLALISLASLLF